MPTDRFALLAAVVVAAEMFGVSAVAAGPWATLFQILAVASVALLLGIAVDGGVLLFRKKPRPCAESSQR